MDLELTNEMHGFNQQIDGFISSKKIDDLVVEHIDSVVQITKKYKLRLSQSEKSRIEIVRLFSGLNLLENFVIASKKHLKEGIVRKENPTSAEDIACFSDKIVELSNLIDAYIIKPEGKVSESINSMSMTLREELRSKNLYPSISGIEKLYARKGLILSKAIANSALKG